MSEPTRVGGPGMRGCAVFLILWTAMSLPHVLGLLDAYPVHAAVAAGLALGVGLGLARVVYRTDARIGLLFAVTAGWGMWLAWVAMAELGEVPTVYMHLGALGMAAFMAVLLAVARAVIVRRQGRAGYEVQSPWDDG
jgi:hypothetical protein